MVVFFLVGVLFLSTFFTGKDTSLPCIDKSTLSRFLNAAAMIVT